jgi:hypothetical protein
MTKFTTEIGFKGMQNPDEVGAAAWTTCAWPATWCSATCSPAWPGVAARSPPAMPTPSTPPSCRPRASTSPLFPETATLMRTARAGAVNLMDTEAALA